jgi:hypothetical protein
MNNYKNLHHWGVHTLSYRSAARAGLHNQRNKYFLVEEESDSAVRDVTHQIRYYSFVEPFEAFETAAVDDLLTTKELKGMEAYTVLFYTQCQVVQYRIQYRTMPCYFDPESHQ